MHIRCIVQSIVIHELNFCAAVEFYIHHTIYRHCSCCYIIHHTIYRYCSCCYIIRSEFQYRIVSYTIDHALYTTCYILHTTKYMYMYTQYVYMYTWNHYHVFYSFMSHHVKRFNIISNIVACRNITLRSITSCLKYYITGYQIARHHTAFTCSNAFCRAA